MRRFNQAWLLNPSNGTALWGMGSVLSNKEDHRAAVKVFAEAEIPLRSNIGFQIDYARAFCFAVTALGDSAITDDALSRFASIHYWNPTNAINLQNWAMTLYFLKRYDEAWERIQLAKSTANAGLLSPTFIQDLEKKVRKK